MFILHLIPSYKPAYIYGGPIVSVGRLCEAQAALGHEVAVYTTTANGAAELDVPVAQPVMVDGVSVWYFPRITGDHTHISPALWWHLWKTVRQYEAVHIHSWWNFLVLGAVCACWLRGVRPVLSPRGMLSAYSFTHENSFKKTVIHRLLGKWLLGKTVFHATTALEVADAHRVIPQWQGFVAPNLIQLPVQSYTYLHNNLFILAFLSRIDAKKGLDILLKALGQVNFPFRLQIAGSGEDAYLQSLQSLAASLGLTALIEWVGWKSGEEKYRFLAKADLFVLTSHNENFANSVIEALAVGTPVLVSDQVGLYDTVAAQRWGWVTGLSVGEIAEQLTQAYQAAAERARIRQEAPEQVRQVFDSKRIAEDYIEFYQSIK